MFNPDKVMRVSFEDNCAGCCGCDMETKEAGDYVDSEDYDKLLELYRMKSDQSDFYRITLESIAKGNNDAYCDDDYCTCPSCKAQNTLDVVNPPTT